MMCFPPPLSGHQRQLNFSRGFKKSGEWTPLVNPWKDIFRVAGGLRK